MNAKQARAYCALTRESSSATSVADSRRSVVTGTILGVEFNVRSLQLFDDVPQMKISITCSLCRSEGWGNECQQRPAVHCTRGGRIEEAFWGSDLQRGELESFLEQLLKQAAVTHGVLDPLGQTLIIPELAEQLASWHFDLCAIPRDRDKYSSFGRERAERLAGAVEEAIGPLWRALQSDPLNVD